MGQLEIKHGCAEEVSVFFFKTKVDTCINAVYGQTVVHTQPAYMFYGLHFCGLLLSPLEQQTKKNHDYFYYCAVYAQDRRS